MWAAMSLEEYFWDGPNIRVPPCSLPPLAGAHVGLAAVVISSGSQDKIYTIKYKFYSETEIGMKWAQIIPNK